MIPSPPTETYFAYLREGRFMLQRSLSSGEWVYYPRMMAPVSGATDLEWTAPSGRGTVYSTTVMHKRPPEASVNLALVDLDEGPRMLTRVEGVPAEEVKIGMRVVARIVAAEDGPLLVFVPEEAV